MRVLWAFDAYAHCLEGVSAFADVRASLAADAFRSIVTEESVIGCKSGLAMIEEADAGFGQMYLTEW